VRELSRAVQLAPRGAEPRAELGDVYAAQGMTAAAVAEYARALAAHPADRATAARAAVLCAQAEQWDAARQWLVRADGGPATAAAALAAGLLARHDRNLVQARQALQRAVELDRNSAAGYNALADVQEQTGDAAGALLALARAQTLRPRDAGLPRREALLRERQGDAAGAETAYRRALALAPSGELWHNLAELLRRGGRTDDAAAAYRTAMQDPQFRYRAYALNGLGLVAFARNEYPAAIARFGEALAADNRYAEPAVNLAALYRAAGNLPAAQAAAQAALGRDARAHRAHYLLALIAEAQGDRAAARRALAAAVRLAPDNNDYRALAARLGGI